MIQSFLRGFRAQGLGFRGDDAKFYREGLGFGIDDSKLSTRV
jgi:hypothetical protein